MKKVHGAVYSSSKQREHVQLRERQQTKGTLFRPRRRKAHGTHVHEHYNINRRNSRNVRNVSPHRVKVNKLGSGVWQEKRRMAGHRVTTRHRPFAVRRRDRQYSCSTYPQTYKRSTVPQYTVCTVIVCTGCLHCTVLPREQSFRYQ